MDSYAQADFKLAGVSPVLDDFQISVSEERVFGVGLPHKPTPEAVTIMSSAQGAKLEMFWDAMGTWQGMATCGGLAALSADYDLPKRVDFGLPQVELLTLPLFMANMALRGREIEPDVARGDIIVDWSDGVRPDAVLVSAIRNEVTLCCHYHQSTRRWVGMSFRNVPITIMGECPRFGCIQPMREGRGIDWRVFLRSYFPE